MPSRQQYHMGTQISGGGGGVAGSSVPADLAPSLDLGAALRDSAAGPGASSATTPTSPGAEPLAARTPTEPPLVAPLACAGIACGEAIVAIGQDGAAYLRVFERQVLRPHKLQPHELPLAWKCPRCGEPVTIGADLTADLTAADHSNNAAS